MVREPAPQMYPPRPVVPNALYHPPGGGPAAPAIRPPTDGRSAPMFRPPVVEGPAVPVFRPSMGGPAAPILRPPAAPANWRIPAPVAPAQPYPAASSTQTFYTASHDDSDDDSFDASSMMSGVSSAVLLFTRCPKINYRLKISAPKKFQKVIYLRHPDVHSYSILNVTIQSVNKDLLNV